MKIYITLHNLSYILDNLDSDQKELWKSFKTYYDKNPKWIDFTNYWFNEATRKLGRGGESDAGDGITIIEMPNLPIFKIGQDLESRLGIKQGMVQKSFEGPEKFLYEDINEAIAHFQKLLDKDPKNPMFYNVIGEILINKKDPEYNNAIKHFHKALELSPNYRRAHYHLGIAYSGNKNKKAAEEEVAILNRMHSHKYAEMLQEEIKKILNE